VKHPFLLIFLQGILLLSSLDALACTLKMRSFEFAPFAHKDKQGQWIGSDHQYAKALMDASGCMYTVVEAPWARGIDMLKSGKIDFMVEVSKTDERAKHFYFIGPQRMETIILATRKNQYPTISDWRQLDRLDAVLMRQKGSYYGPRFEAVLQQNKRLRSRFLEMSNSQVRLTMLEKGRIDGFLIDEVFADHLLATNEKAKILQKHPLVIHQSPVYFAFSKAGLDQKLLKRIKDGFEKLKRSGQLDKIADKY
jgi:polar amino acid transport system substrate-binding protein